LKDEDAVSQLLQVVQFRKEVKGMGLVSTYVTLEQFRTLLWEHLFQVLHDRYGERPVESFSFNAPINKRASWRAAPKPGLKFKFTHPYPNFPILIRG
jgi:hypothetical protein